MAGPVLQAIIHLKLSRSERDELERVAREELRSATCAGRFSLISLCSSAARSPDGR